MEKTTEAAIYVEEIAWMVMVLTLASLAIGPWIIGVAQIVRWII